MDTRWTVNANEEDEKRHRDILSRRKENILDGINQTSTHQGWADGKHQKTNGPFLQWRHGTEEEVFVYIGIRDIMIAGI